MFKICQYLYEESAWQRGPFILIYISKKLDKWLVVVLEV